MGLRVYDPNNDPDEANNSESAKTDGTAGNSVGNNPIQTTSGDSATTTSNGIGSGSGGSAIPKTGSLASRQGTNSGQFTNIQDYRNANQEGAQNLAKGITNKFKDVTQQGQEDLNKQKGQFQAAYDPQVSGFANTSAALNDQKNTLISGDGTDFNNAVQNVQSGLGAQYTGPSDLANRGLLQQEASDEAALGKSTENDSGRLALLKNFYNRPSYNAGQQKLDTLLLGNQGDQLKQARLESQTLTNQLPDQLNQIQQKVADANTAAANLQNNAMNTASDAATQRRAALSQATADFLKAQNPNTQTYNGGSQTINPGDINLGQSTTSGLQNSLTAQQAQALGIQKWINDQRLNGVNLSDFSANDATKQAELMGDLSGNSANNLNTLYGLIGNSADKLTIGSPLQAGQFQLDQNSLNNFTNSYKNELNTGLTRDNVFDPTLGLTYGGPNTYAGYSNYLNNLPSNTTLVNQTPQGELDSLNKQKQKIVANALQRAIQNASNPTNDNSLIPIK